MRAKREIGIAAAATAVVALIRGRSGLGTTADSAYYIGAAESLLRGDGLTFSGSPLTIFPPGTSLGLAAGMWAGLDAENAARMVILISAIAAGAAAAILCRRLIPTTYPRAVVVAVIACSSGLAIAWGMILSEATYIAWSTAALVVMLEALQTPAGRHSRRLAAVAGVLVAVSFLWRYAALAAVVSGVLTFLLARRRREAAWFCGAAITIPAGWVVRNLFADGTMFGPRTESVSSLPKAAASTLNALSYWVVPLDAGRATIVAGGLLAAAGAVVVLKDRPCTTSYMLLGPHLAIGYTYAVVSTMLSRIDLPGRRLLAPLFIPLVILLASAVVAHGGRARIAAAALVAGVSCVSGILLALGAF